jgi:hypothetical protein
MIFAQKVCQILILHPRLLFSCKRIHCVSQVGLVQYFVLYTGFYRFSRIEHSVVKLS